MTRLTQRESLQEIFYNNESRLSDAMLVWKHRYKNGTLSQKLIDQILKDNGYEIVQEALYAKK